MSLIKQRVDRFNATIRSDRGNLFFDVRRQAVSQPEDNVLDQVGRIKVRQIAA